MLPTVAHRLKRLALYISVGLFSASLAACASLLLPESLTPGSGALVAATEPAPGYPGPGATPTAPLPTVSHNDFIATPLPEERVVAGAIVEIPEPRNNFPYTFLEDHIERDGIVLERVFVQYHGQEIRLGDDYGSSNAEAATEKYLIWTYHAHGDETNLPLKSGLYVYEIRTGELTRIADGWKVGFSEIDDNWVLFISWENALPSSQFPGGETPGDTRPLYAYSIISGQTITLTTNLPVILGRMTQSFYDVSGNRAGWVEYDMLTRQYAIKVSNLSSGRIQTLNVPDLTQPRFFSISDDLAVWRDTYWHGYSLTQDALFTVPYAPPGWESSSASIMVVAKQSGLEWQVRVSDNEVRYFRGPILLRGQRPTAWESLVIPLQQTIAPPTAPPLAGTPPAAYP